jgi:hypothetical protein
MATSQGGAKRASRARRMGETGRTRRETAHGDLPPHPCHEGPACPSARCAPSAIAIWRSEKLFPSKSPLPIRATGRPGALRQAGHGWPAPASAQDVPTKGKAMPPASRSRADAPRASGAARHPPPLRPSPASGRGERSQTGEEVRGGGEAESEHRIAGRSEVCTKARIALWVFAPDRQSLNLRIRNSSRARPARGSSPRRSRCRW